MTHESSAPSPDGLGAMLREARERAGLELSEVAERTHVRKTYLEALENEALDDLPEDVYARNFLRLYARTVGVDPDDALARFSALRARAAGRTTGAFRTEAGTRPAAAPSTERARPSEPRAPEGGPAPRPASDRLGPVAAMVRQVGPLLMTLVLAGALVGTAVWGFNQLLFRPDPPTSEAAAPDGGAGPGDPQAGASDAGGDAPGGVTPVLPGGDALPAEILLTIDSDPPGAEVSVDAFPLPGTTPISDVPVTARAERTLRITRDGYQPYEEIVDMSRDRTLSVSLEPEQASDGAEAASDDEDGVVVEVREATWLEAYQSTTRGEGERLVYTTAQPGERFVFERPVYLHFGNAGGVDVAVDGEPFGPLGSGGAVTGQAFPAP